jgi:predicted DNA-binding transcriptional regulator YafY
MPHKHSDHTAEEKLLRLYSLLVFSHRREFSLKELAEYLGCTKQTVLRLKDRLEASGFGTLMESRRGREAIYRLDAPQGPPVLDISAQGLEELVLCRNFFLHLFPKVPHSQADEALAAANAPTQEIAGLAQVYTKGRIDYAPYQGILQTILRAMRENKACRLSYQAAWRSAARAFLFAPKRLIAYHETISALGWEMTENGQARFDKPVSLYLHRCREARLTRRTTTHLPLPPPAQGQDGEHFFGVMPGQPFTIKARFTREAADYVREREWSSRQSCVPLEDGSVVLEFEAQSRVEALSWLLSFGARATVLEPEDLREELRNQARGILENSP